MALRSPAPILVVDDDPDLRAGISDVLATLNYRVETAVHGADALVRLEDAARELPCALVLDMMMPVMNGWELLAEMRRRPTLAHLPVVVVTAAVSTSWDAAAPVRSVLSKPFDVAQLLAAVDGCGCTKAGVSGPRDTQNTSPRR
jgi:CheY-like chemotaxis protein